METALLLPPILIWMVWLILFLVFLTDMAVLKSEVNRIADEASMIWNRTGHLETGDYKVSLDYRSFGEAAAFPSGKVAGDSEKRLRKRLKQRLLLASLKGCQVRTGPSRISVRAKAAFSWPFPGLYARETGGLTFTAKGKSPVNDWEEMLRRHSALVEDREDDFD